MRRVLLVDWPQLVAITNLDASPRIVTKPITIGTWITMDYITWITMFSFWILFCTFSDIEILKLDDSDGKAHRLFGPHLSSTLMTKQDQMQIRFSKLTDNMNHDNAKSS